MFGKKLIIHAGLHKTGSTSLQTALWDGRYGRSVRFVVPSNWIIPDQSVGERHNWGKLVRETAKAGFSSIILASDEAVFGQMENVYCDLPKRAEIMLRALGEVNFAVVLYLRGQPDWAESMLRQQIRQGAQICPEHWAQQFLSLRNSRLTNLVADLLSCLGPERLNVRFQTATDVVEDFDDFIGLTPIRKRQGRHYALNQSDGFSIFDRINSSSLTVRASNTSVSAERGQGRKGFLIPSRWLSKIAEIALEDALNLNTKYGGEKFVDDKGMKRHLDNLQARFKF